MSHSHPHGSGSRHYDDYGYADTHTDHLDYDPDTHTAPSSHHHQHHNRTRTTHISPHASASTPHTYTRSAHDHHSARSSYRHYDDTAEPRHRSRHSRSPSPRRSRYYDDNRMPNDHPPHRSRRHNDYDDDPIAYKRPDAHRQPSSSPPPDEDLLAYIQQQQQHNDKDPRSASAHDPDAQKIKLERFKQGASTKKSRYQREREETERKKKQAEEDAQVAYRDFVQAMEGGGADDHGRDKDKYGASSSRPRGGFVSAGGGHTAYQGSRPPPVAAASTTKMPSLADFGEDEDADDAGGQAASADKPKKEPPGKRKRAMDDFLGELQRDQAKREERLRSRVGEGGSISSLIALEGQKVGSRDLGDPMTTNVCVMNLPANVSEESLGEFFAQWGDVATVKIMWPRGEEAYGGAGGGITNLRKDRSAGLTGFVAYMQRSDAEYALKETDGIRWGGSLIKTGWSKSMPLPPRPLYCMPASSSKHSGAIADVVLPDEPAHRRARSAMGPQRGARVVVQHRKQQAPAEADASPSVFTDDGDDSLASTDTGEESEDARLRKHRSRSHVLGPRARRRFEAMLRGLTPRRERIARLTAFAIEHATAADEIATTLTASLLIPSTPIPRKLARLHTISDVLHNSAAPLPNAWKYRAAFEARLPAAFAHLGAVRASFPGRMKQEQFRRLVLAVLEVWDDWLVFSPDALARLREAFESRHTNVGLGREEEEEAARDGAPAAAAAGEGEEDLDGEAMDDVPASVPRPTHPPVDDPGAGAETPAAVDPPPEEEEEDLDGEAM